MVGADVGVPLWNMTHAVGYVRVTHVCTFNLSIGYLKCVCPFVCLLVRIEELNCNSDII